MDSPSGKDREAARLARASAFVFCPLGTCSMLKYAKVRVNSLAAV